MQNQNRIIEAVRELSQEARESGLDDMAKTLDQVLSAYGPVGRVKPRQVRALATSPRPPVATGSVVSMGPDRFVFGHRVAATESAVENRKAVFRRSQPSPIIQRIREIRDNRIAEERTAPQALVLTERVG